MWYDISFTDSTMLVLFLLITCIVFLICLILIISRRKYSYWKDRNVTFLEPLTFFGNYKDYLLMKVYHPVITKDICEKFPNEPYVGVFYGTEPALLVKDPELIKLVTTTDFWYFNGREVSDHTHKEVITQNIFFTHGERWKIIRQSLAPLLSSAKVKNMFYLVKKSSADLEMMLERAHSLPSVEIRAFISRYVIDVVTECGFGLRAEVMKDEAGASPFSIISRQILKISTVNGIKNFARTIWPGIFYALGFRIFSPEVDHFFHKLLTEVFKQRNYEPSTKNDFVDLLLSLRKNDVISSVKGNDNSGKEKCIKVNDDLLVSNSVAFFAGGFETTSSSMAFVLYELAKNEDVQKRAIAEVDAYVAQHSGGVEYDVLSELPYLAACLDETLRHYPLLATITRECMEDYTLPDGLRLEKGLRIHIPVLYLHYNPEYFVNPEEFDPERFMGEKKFDIRAQTYLPFGEGPRVCIGTRFAKMTILAGLTTILKKYCISLSEDTPRRMHFEPKGIVAQPAGPIHLKFVARRS